MPFTPPSPSYSNPFGTGDRRTDIGVTVSPAFAGGIPSNLVDGATGSNSTDSVFFTNARNDYLITFDFGISSSVLVTEITWKQSSTSSHGTWQLRGSNDNSSWTNIGSTFTLGGSTTQVLDYSANSTAYRYLQLQHTGAGTTSSSPWLQEIEFKIAEQNEFGTNSHNLGGRGDRTGFMTVTTTATLGYGTVDNIVDGALTSNATDAFWMNNGQSGRQFVFDFGSDVIIDKLLWIQSAAGSQGTWRFAGSNDGTTEDEILLLTVGGTSHFAVGAAAETRVVFEDTTSGNPNPGYRYYIMTQVSGTTNSGPYVHEARFATVEPSPVASGGSLPVIFIIS